MNRIEPHSCDRMKKHFSPEKEHVKHHYDLDEKAEVYYCHYCGEVLAKIELPVSPKSYT